MFLDVFDWTESERLRDFITHHLRPSRKQCFVYLHGRIDGSKKPFTVPKNLVLCDSEYVSRYILTQSTLHKLLAIFMTRPILFVGFSFEDPALQMIFQTLTAHLGGSAAPGCTHFMLRPEPEEGNDRAESSWLRGKYGIQAVYYKRGKQHADLPLTLRQIASVIDLCKGGSETLDEQGRLKLIEESLQRVLASPKPAMASQSRPPAAPPDDPNKWQFGNSPSRNGYELSAKVAEISRSWFSIELMVTAASGKRLEQVEFFLHPSFPKHRRVKTTKHGRVKLELEAYGAFTVGAIVNPESDATQGSNTTRLELDLAELKDAPARFRAR